MKRIFFISIIAVILGNYMSCTKAVIEEEETEPITELVKYDPDVKAIMTAYCTSCHGGAAPIGGFPLEDYESVKFYSESEGLVERMNDVAAPMPPGGLISASERQIIDKWVTDGYLEN